MSKGQHLTKGGQRDHQKIWMTVPLKLMEVKELQKPAGTLRNFSMQKMIECK